MNQTVALKEPTVRLIQIERTAYGYANFNHLVTRIKLEEKDAIIKEKASDYYLAA